MSAATEASGTASGAGSRGKSSFLQLLINTAVANLISNYLWFALVFWVYLETRSILATGVLGGIYMLLISLLSMHFGSVVDRHRKHFVMRASAWISLAAFIIATSMFFSIPHSELLNTGAPWLWIFALVLLAGCVVEMMRNLALSTTVTMLIEPDRRANANGLVGTVQGITFIATSVFSGLSVGLLGMGPTIVIAMVGTVLPLIHLHLIRVREPEIVRNPEYRAIDFRGGFSAILAVPGLLALVLFSTFNNLTGGVFMALVDPYGLTLFSVEMWGIVFGVAAVGMVLGGLIVAKFGLGRNPLRTMLIFVAVTGLLGMVFGIREWGWLLGSGEARSMALIFVVAGLASVLLTTGAILSRSYRTLSHSYAHAAPTNPVGLEGDLAAH